MSSSKSVAESSSPWDILGPDLTELILSRLPIPSLLRTARVCKQWHCIIHSDAFKTRVSNSKRQPWFCVTSRDDQVYAFDPRSDCWITLPGTVFPCNSTVIASDGFLFATWAEQFSFKPVLGGTWHRTRNLSFSRRDPLIGVCNEPDCLKPAGFIVAAGGIKPNDWSAVEIYNRTHDSWETCPPLPEFFRPENLMQALCSAMHKGKFYVLSTCWGFISLFDMEKRCWSPVRTLKPPGAVYTRLIACQDCLILAGLSCLNGQPEFNLWWVDEEDLEFREIGIMPPGLLPIFFGTGSDLEFMNKFVKWGGCGDLVYVFNSRNGQACFCEIREPGFCTWRRVEGLPESAEKLQGASCCCSSRVSLQDILMQ